MQIVPQASNFEYERRHYFIITLGQYSVPRLLEADRDIYIDLVWEPTSSCIERGSCWGQRRTCSLQYRGVWQITKYYRIEILKKCLMNTTNMILLDENLRKSLLLGKRDLDSCTMIKPLILNKVFLLFLFSLLIKKAIKDIGLICSNRWISQFA